MPRRETPKRLRDVSHLFLSGKDDDSRKAEGSPEILIMVPVLEAGLCRAFIASGIASALSSPGISVTLLESGTSLPNAGYYFALSPEEYLEPALHPDRRLRVEVSGGLRYSYSTQPCRQGGFERDFPVPAAAHVIVSVFDRSSLTPGSGAVKIRGYALDNFSLRAGGRRELSEAVVIFCGDEDEEDAHEIISSIRGVFASPQAIIASSAEEKSFTWTDQVEKPVMMRLHGDFQKDAARRTPPGSPFFGGLAANLMQTISLKLRSTRDGTAVGERT